ncbi:MAG: DUF1428 family protein [Nitrososphaera sp.]
MNKTESATQEIGSHLEAFFYRVPKKNHDAIAQNLKKFVPWFEKHGARIEYFQFAGSQKMEGMSMLAIDKALSAAEDEDIWVELQYYHDSRHRDDTFAKMMLDKSLEPLGNEFLGLITKGSSLVSGGFSRLGTEVGTSQRKATQFTYPSDREIVIERVFNAPAERLFKACTDPSLVPQWWGPRRYTTVVDRDEVRPSGVWRYISKGQDGGEFAFNGVYREIVPGKRLVRTFEFEPMPGHVSVETATFEEQGGKTKLKVTSLFQNVEDRDGMRNSGMEEGASESWDRLAELVEK